MKQPVKENKNDLLNASTEFVRDAACDTYTMKSSMSMDLALFSQKLASCRTPSIFLAMLKSAGMVCHMVGRG